MQLYRYSPIANEQVLHEAIAYVAEASSALCRQVVGEVFPITSLTVFAHYPSESICLKKLLLTMGEQVGNTNGPRVALHAPINLGSHTITHLRVREPDPYHAQVGCVDLNVPDYDLFKRDFLATHPNNLRLLVRPEYELIELFDPDADVLGYVLSEPERSTR